MIRNFFTFIFPKIIGTIFVITICIYTIPYLISMVANIVLIFEVAENTAQIFIAIIATVLITLIIMLANIIYYIVYFGCIYVVMDIRDGTTKWTKGLELKKLRAKKLSLNK